jgi:aminoglycoside phosphotransferase (APT) family kinase protein
VLVHGDIHEGQLLADGGELTGVIDWEVVGTLEEHLAELRMIS